MQAAQEKKHRAARWTKMIPKRNNARPRYLATKDGNDGRCGWLLGQESDFADEVALLHVRDLRSCDTDLRTALANKEQRFEPCPCLIELPGDEEPRNLYVLEARSACPVGFVLEMHNLRLHKARNRNHRKQYLVGLCSTPPYP